MASESLCSNFVLENKKKQQQQKHRKKKSNGIGSFRVFYDVYDVPE